ncbi:MAG: PQQ-binding-like beta-propeller repeat protein [Pirellulaceae bacterium]|nr:PQQ-binding-like beta-propeller repeat protein [Pirellulaceae bacterium]
MLNRRKFIDMIQSGIGGSMALTTAHSLADDWPQWRGADRTGRWLEDGIAKKLPAGQLPIVWTVPIGPGYSGPTVANGRVFVTDKQEASERVLCFSEKDGEPLWTHEYPCRYRIQYPAGPRASVSIDQGTAFALGAMGDLHAIEAQTGKVVWHRDLNIDYKIDMPTWGISASPLVYQDLIIVHIGGSDGACILGLDCVSGKERWRSLDDRAQYSAPILIRQANQDVVVVWTGDSVVGMDPLNGKPHWQIPFRAHKMPIGVPTPVVEGDRLFVSSFYDGSLMMRIPSDRLAAEKLWQVRGKDEKNTDALHCMIGTPLFRNGFIYGVDSYGQLRCLDAKNGKRLWENLTATPQDRWSTIHFVQHGEETWMLNESGELLIAKLTPEGFEELSRSKLIDPTLPQLSRRGDRGVCWSHPAFANRHVFARSDEQLLCANVGL